MRIGTMFLGKVDELDHESVQTKFFVLGVPLIPMASFYVLAEDVGGVKGFEIPLSSKSVLLGYVRIFSWLAALLFGVFAYIERRDAGGLWIMSALSLAAAVGTTFFVGGLPKEEKLRRTLLKALTGVGAPPSLLPADLVSKTSERLLKVWKDDHETEAWETAAESGKSDPLLFALAEYHRREDLARHVLAAMLKGEPEVKQGPYRGKAA